MERRTFVKGVLAAPILSTAQLARDGASAPTDRAVYVRAGEDRFGEPLALRGPLHRKVATEDSNGGVFLFQQRTLEKGGPFRHLHHEQDEWFFVVEGEFAFEVGDESFRLSAGDSLFAPRGVPHAWAHVDESPGSMMVMVQPAGDLEAFFGRLAGLSRPPTWDERAAMLEAHGMSLVGPPLPVD